MEKLLWWGYLHVEGDKNIHVKRYFSPLDTEEAIESPFVKRVFYPFEADSREDAIKKIKELL